jgi:hypothetical protein
LSRRPIAGAAALFDPEGDLVLAHFAQAATADLSIIFSQAVSSSGTNNQEIAGGLVAPPAWT